MVALMLATGDLRFQIRFSSPGTGWLKYGSRAGEASNAIATAGVRSSEHAPAVNVWLASCDQVVLDIS